MTIKFQVEPRRASYWLLSFALLVAAVAAGSLPSETQASRAGSSGGPEFTYAHFTFRFGFPGLAPIDFPDTSERAGGTIAVVADPATEHYVVPDRNGNTANAVVGSLTNQYVVMDKTSTNPAESLALIRDFHVNDVVRSGKVSVAARVQVDNDTTVRELSLYANKTLPIAGVLIGDSNITALDGTILSRHVATGAWLDVEITLDLDTRTYDVAVNGKVAAIHLAWSNDAGAPKSFSRLVFRSRGSETAGKFLIDDVLIKTSAKVNIRTESGATLSAAQQTRTVPAAYQICLPDNYDPNKKYPIILHNVRVSINFAADLCRQRQAPGMPEFVVVAVHPVSGGIITPESMDVYTGTGYPYNVRGWYGNEISTYIKKSIRPGDTIPWSGAAVRAGSAFDEQSVIETFLQIKEDYNVEDKFYWDGHSAAGIALYNVLMYQPEYMKAVFANDANWQGPGSPPWTGTGMDAWNLGNGQTKPVSTHPDRVALPIRLAIGGGYGSGRLDPDDNDMNHTDRIYNLFADVKEGVLLPPAERMMYARTFGRQAMRAMLAMEANGFRNIELYWMVRYGHAAWSAESMQFFKEVYFSDKNGVPFHDVRKEYNGPAIPAPVIERQGSKYLITNFATDYKANTYKYGQLQYSFDGERYYLYLKDGITNMRAGNLTMTVRYGGLGGVVNPADIAVAYKPSPASAPTALTVKTVTTTPEDFIGMIETAKNSGDWRLSFWGTVDHHDGSTERVRYEIKLAGNNPNLAGEYRFGDDVDLAGSVLVYDIKGNGSNIKELKLVR